MKRFEKSSPGMLFLGTLDDKTIEYPFGKKADIKSNALQDILHHILFGCQPIVLEEGFILASEEAVNPTMVQPILLPAIKSGLVRVSTRYGDMHEYARERRRKQHLAPPENIEGDCYLTELQKTCEASRAFIDYPPEEIDEITFNRFVECANSEFTLKVLECCSVDMPKGFVSLYENMYELGNNGKKWTARSAWENTLKISFPNKPEIVHSLMAMVNRERQILRASAISKVNNIEMMVETGFDDKPHGLVTPIHSEMPMLDTNYNIYPRVSMDILYSNLNQLFQELGDATTPLHHYRNLYAELLESRKTIDMKSLERAARNYENEIYAFLNAQPIEKNIAINVVGTAFVGTITGGVISALWHSIRNRPDKPLFSEKLKKNHTRREFLRGAIAGALLTTMYVADNKSGGAIESGVRLARTTWKEDLADNYIQHLDNNLKSHQLLRVDKAALNGLTI